MAWDDSGKRHTENVLLSLLKDLLHLFLSDSVTPHLQRSKVNASAQESSD